MHGVVVVSRMESSCFFASNSYFGCFISIVLVFWVMKAPFQVSRSLPNRQKTYNIELFWRVILAQRSLRNLRMPVTCFITAETVEDRTSWRKIQYSEDCAWHGGLRKWRHESVETRFVERSTTSFSNIGLRWRKLSKTGLCGISSQLLGSFVLAASREFGVEQFLVSKTCHGMKQFKHQTLFAFVKLPMSFRSGRCFGHH